VQKLSSTFCSGAPFLPLGKETKFHTHIKVIVYYTSILMGLNKRLEDRGFRSINQQDLCLGNALKKYWSHLYVCNRTPLKGVLRHHRGHNVYFSVDDPTFIKRYRKRSYFRTLHSDKKSL
jgi:hypothetical protein